MRSCLALFENGAELADLIDRVQDSGELAKRLGELAGMAERLQAWGATHVRVGDFEVRFGPSQMVPSKDSPRAPQMSDDDIELMSS